VPSSPKTIWRKIGFGIGISLLAVLGAAQFYKKDLIRFQFVLTLFEPAGIVENFRSMTRVFDYRTVRRGGPVYRIPYESKRLPESYPYQGQNHDLAQWIERTVTSGIIIIHDGKIAFERYYLGNHAATYWVSWSACQPVVSALVGFALEDGLIRSLDDPVGDYVPRLKASGYHGVTLLDVLQMSSGVGFNEDGADWHSDINRLWRRLALGKALDDVVVSLENERPPGTFNRPVGMDAQVLAMVLREATGRSLSTYMEEKLWSRLGVESDAFWIVDGDGMELAFGGLHAQLRDYARFGLFFLNEGETFRDQQILPARWIRDSVTPVRPHLPPGADNPASSSHMGYGYQWRLPETPDGDYCAIGTYGQFVYVHPRYRVVIAKTSACADDNPSGNEMAVESLAVFRFIAEQMDRHP
jgi:CubicO group peptidase (beta-lactamase class C family)